MTNNAELINNTCEHCGGSQLISGLMVSASGGGGDVRTGLLCKEKKKRFFGWSPERDRRETLLLTYVPLAAL
jgi:hypothetical protein